MRANLGFHRALRLPVAPQGETPSPGDGVQPSLQATCSCQHRKMPGIRVINGDLRISGIHIEVGPDGDVVAPDVEVHLRTDMWPFWLEEAIDAAADAVRHSEAIPAAAQAQNNDEVARLMTRELRASMRAIASSAFAIDSFYATVKARSPAHPHEAVWRSKRTSRHAQIFQTLQYHLSLKNVGAKEINRRIKEIFRYRRWAVHPGSAFATPVWRPDVDSSVDWHFMAFRSANASAVAGMTAQMMDTLVNVLERGSADLVEYKAGARRAMDSVVEHYVASDLTPFVRAEPPEAGPSA